MMEAHAVWELRRIHLDCFIVATVPCFTSPGDIVADATTTHAVALSVASSLPDPAQKRLDYRSQSGSGPRDRRSATYDDYVSDR